MKIGKIASHTIIISEQKGQNKENKKQEQKNKRKEIKEKITEQSVNPDLGSNFDISI